MYVNIPYMDGIFTYIYHKNQPNVGKYTSPMDGMGMSPYLSTATLFDSPAVTSLL